MRNPESHRPEEARQEDTFSPGEINDGATLVTNNARHNGQAGKKMGDPLSVDFPLRESEEHYCQLVQTLPAAIYTTDAAGRITLFNAAAELWGRARKIGEDHWCGSYRI